MFVLTYFDCCWLLFLDMKGLKILCTNVQLWDCFLKEVVRVLFYFHIYRCKVRALGACPPATKRFRGRWGRQRPILMKKALNPSLSSCVKCDRNCMLEPRDQFNWIERGLFAVKQHLPVDEILDAIKVCVFFYIYNIFLERGSKCRGNPGRNTKSRQQASPDGNHGANAGQGSEEASLRSDGVWQA